MTEEVKEPEVAETEEVVEEVEAEEPSLMELWEQVANPEEAPEEVAEPAEEVTEPVEGEEPTEEAPVVEEEDALPEYTKNIEGEINLEDKDEVDAINYWANGPKEAWTKDFPNMSDHQKEVFVKHQSAFDKSKEVAKEETSTPFSGYSKEELSEAKTDMARIVAGDRDTLRKYGLTGDDVEKQPETKTASVNDNLRSFAEAVESGDKEAIIKNMENLLVGAKNEASSAASKAKGEALEELKRSQLEEGRSSWLDQIGKDTRRLEEEQGSSFTQYKQKIANLLSLTDRGIPNPLTGKMIMTVDDAFSFVKNMDNGGQRVASVKTPSEVTPPAGAGGGAEPQFTESDYAGDTKSFMEKAWSQAQRNSNT